MLRMGPNFDVSAPPTLVTEFSNILESLNIKLVVVGESVFVSCVFVLLIMKRYEFNVQY